MQNKRLLSLDILRGITIAGMIMVNNPGSWGSIYAPLKHAAWNGLTPTDLVFPFFMFIMGVSMYISYSKFGFKFSGRTCRGMSALRDADMNWFLRLWDAGFLHLEKWRIMGVLQRLALVSFGGSLVLLIFNQKLIPWLIGVILIGYSALMITTNSLELSVENLAARVDLAILGDSHMYHISGIALDPEGWISTIPCIAHVLIGVMAGALIMGAKDNHLRIERLGLLGAVILMLGFLWDYAMPINKTLWSSSYVLVTCGLASLLLAVLIWLIDVKGYKAWTRFFETFGVNPMAIFVFAGLFANLISNIGFTTAAGKWVSLKGYLYADVLSPMFGDTLGSLVFALMFICFCWLMALPLYLKKIYIKI